ncbi:MAG: hypothetical protein II344_01200 [Bacteroidales bacterium]|nr:hypothetical protein [Bacteroidales bacterium]
MNAELFRATTKKYMELRHINTQEKLRAHTTCGSSTTFRKYWNDPDLMPMGMWEQIMDCLNVPQEERFDTLK